MLTQNALPRPVSSVHSQQFGVPVLETLVDEKGNLFVFLSGIASTVIGSLVTYHPDGSTILLATTDAAKGYPIAIAMSANNLSTTFGWYQIFGQGSALAAANATKEVAVYTSAAAGVVDITSTSQTKLNRFVITTTNGGAQALTPVMLAHPSGF